MDRALSWLLTGWRPVAFFVICLFWVAVFAASVFAPYTPLTVRYISVQPPEVCPSDGVTVTLNRSWRQPNLLFGIRTVDTTSTWTNEETGATYEAIVSRGGEPTLGDGKATSPLVRTAPPDPGEYRLYTTYLVQGRTVLLPAYQQIEDLRSRDTVTVLAETLCTRETGND